MRAMEQQLILALAGVGDVSRERLFRMQVTLCLHRAVTEEECSDLKRRWGSLDGRAVAGGPVEVLRSRGVSEAPSAQPCRSPRKNLLPGARDPRLWIPGDCGECEPCLARKAIWDRVASA